MRCAGCSTAAGAQTDTATETVLQGVFFPQDAHSWGKEYAERRRATATTSATMPRWRLPAANKYHLFAVTTVTDGAAPMFRVLQNSEFRVWNWLSIEGPVAGNKCFTTANARVDCVTGRRRPDRPWCLLPSFDGPVDRDLEADDRCRKPRRVAPPMNTLFTNNAIPANLCGIGTVARHQQAGATTIQFTGNGCTHRQLHDRASRGNIVVPADRQTTALRVDGDDAVDLTIDGNAIVGWYGGHGNDRSTAGLAQSLGDGIAHRGQPHHRVPPRRKAAAATIGASFLGEPVASADGRDDYFVRVLTCPASNPDVREATCKGYPVGAPTVYKPTGILHDYGENQKMYFGLITGSQDNNLEGGVLRKQHQRFRRRDRRSDGPDPHRTSMASSARSTGCG